MILRQHIAKLKKKKTERESVLLAGKMTYGLE